MLAFAIGPVGGALLSLVSLPVITWLYSAEDVGRIAMLQVVSSFFVLIFSLGLDQAYVREYHESDDRAKLLTTCLVPGLLLLCFLLAGFGFFPGLASRLLFDVDSQSISLMVSTCFIAVFISRFLSLILRMQEKGMAFSLSQILSKLIFLIIICMYGALFYGLDLFHLLMAHTFSLTAVTLLYSWNTRHTLKAAFAQLPDLKLFKSLFAFGAPLILGGAAFWGLTAMDRVFLRSFSSFDELALYSVATSFAAAAILFQSIFSTVWVPTVYKWVAEGIDFERVDKVTDVVLAAVVFIFVLAGFFAWLVTLFLPDEYASVQYILLPCMCYPLFYTLSETTAVGIGVSKKSGYSMLASLIAVVANLLGSFWLVPLYGAKGAAVSTAFAFWIFLVCRTEFSCLVWRPLPRTRLYSVTLACFIAVVVHAFLSERFSVHVSLMWGAMAVTAAVIFRRTMRQGCELLSSKFRFALR